MERTEEVARAEADDALVERSRQGEADAYARLVRRYQDLAFRTAYVVLGCAPGTVKSRLARALGRLRQALTAAELPKADWQEVGRG